MNPLRRPEVLLLLLLTAGIGGYFLWTGRQRDGIAPKTESGKNPGALTVSSAAVIDEGGSQKLRIVYRIENLQAPAASGSDLTPRLTAGDGSELPLFFQPGDFPPDAAALQAGSSGQVDFWLKSPPAGALTLEVAGLRQTVPTAVR